MQDLTTYTILLIVFITISLVMSSLIAIALFKINKILQIIASGEANIKNLKSSFFELKEDFKELKEEVKSNEKRFETLKYDFDLCQKIHKNR